MKENSGWKAERGNMVHKALELLARRRLAEQNALSCFTDPELNQGFSVSEMDWERACLLGFDHYRTKNESGRNWTEEDYQDVRRWVEGVCTFRDGLFNPLNRTVLAPEQYFDMEIDEPWANYTYYIAETGETIEGRLSIKGTIDLVTEVGDGIIEYVDWKTGKRWDWGKDREKTYERLYDDAQLLLYYYALSRLYPDAETIFVTIYFTQDGGPYTVAFEQKHRDKALQKLRRRFESIRNTMVPKRIINDSSKLWKCKMCSFYKEKHPGTDQSKCDFLYQEILQLGLDKVMLKHGKAKAWANYGSGGGVSNRD